MLINNKVYLNLDKRTKWDEGEETIIGYYDLIIPKKNSLGLKLEGYEVLEKIREELGKDIDEIKIYDEEIFMRCYQGSGDYVYNLQHVYSLKNEIENRVKEKLNRASIWEYTLIVKLDTVY